MASLGVSWASGKEMPLLGIHYVSNAKTLSENGLSKINDDESIKDEYKSPIKW